MVLLLLTRSGCLGRELDILLLDAGNPLENWMLILSLTFPLVMFLRHSQDRDR
jgi:hypothetical protein